MIFIKRSLSFCGYRRMTTGSLISLIHFQYLEQVWTNEYYQVCVFGPCQILSFLLISRIFYPALQKQTENQVKSLTKSTTAGSSKSHRTFWHVNDSWRERYWSIEKKLQIFCIFIYNGGGNVSFISFKAFVFTKDVENLCLTSGQEYTFRNHIILHSTCLLSCI